jgi:hypothetical protein
MRQQVWPFVAHRFAGEDENFFCPEACYQLVASPYCVIKVRGRRAVPCRVALSAREAAAAVITATREAKTAAAAAHLAAQGWV